VDAPLSFKSLFLNAVRASLAGDQIQKKTGAEAPAEEFAS